MIGTTVFPFGGTHGGSRTDMIWIDAKGRVLALCRASAEESWRTPLKARELVRLTIDGDDLLARTRGVEAKRRQAAATAAAVAAAS